MKFAGIELDIDEKKVIKGSRLTPGEIDDPAFKNYLPPGLRKEEIYTVRKKFDLYDVDSAKRLAGDDCVMMGGGCVQLVQVEDSKGRELDDLYFLGWFKPVD